MCRALRLRRENSQKECDENVEWPRYTIPRSSPVILGTYGDVRMLASQHWGNVQRFVFMLRGWG